jgi:hypothetical protein
MRLPEIDVYRTAREVLSLMEEESLLGQWYVDSQKQKLAFEAMEVPQLVASMVSTLRQASRRYQNKEEFI